MRLALIKRWSGRELSSVALLRAVRRVSGSFTPSVKSNMPLTLEKCLDNDIAEAGCRVISGPSLLRIGVDTVKVELANRSKNSMERQ